MQDKIITSLIDGQPIKTNYQTYTARDGVTLSYQRYGSGTPLLLIHGLGSSSMDWELQYADLGEQFDLIIPDLRGFGHSTQAYFDMKSPAASISQFSEDTVDLLSQLNINSCPVLGFSMGGAVAFQMALDDLNTKDASRFSPESLIIVNSLPSFEIDTLRKRYLIGLRRLLTRCLSMPALAKFLSGKMFPNNPVLSAQMTDRNGRNKKKPYREALLALLHWRAGPQLKDLEQRTLYIAAENDYTPVEDKVSAARMMKDARVEVVKDSMHGTPFDQTEIFNKTILEFLNNK